MQGMIMPRAERDYIDRRVSIHSLFTTALNLAKYDLRQSSD